VACFDTAFSPDHATLATLLRIPRRLEATGVRHWGDSATSTGRVILAHLGNGASLAAVRDGRSVDTSMGFTPTAGLPMSTRSGDLDPGLVSNSRAPTT
jgi:acetate kinase